MKQLAELLQAMKRAGVILDYAVFGAVAQMRYTEPVATLDADILVDLLRIHSLLNANAVTPDDVERLAARHGLLDRWKAFKRKVLDD